jgi:hypothetical protein
MKPGRDGKNVRTRAATLISLFPMDTHAASSTLVGGKNMMQGKQSKAEYMMDIFFGTMQENCM